MRAIPCVLLLLAATPARAEVLAAPVTLGATFDAALAVSIRPFRAEATEIWYIAGSCPGAPDPTVIRLVDFAAIADLTVYLTDAPEKAHRVICLTNGPLP